MSAASQSFRDRILDDLLPAFCDDPSRSWGAAGFKADWGKIDKVDAADFLRGLDGGLVKHRGRGLYRAPRSSASEQFFWSGARTTNPRSITLWVEPIITVAVLARLHFDLGWPKESLGTQSKDWAFDVTAFLPADSKLEHIACEIKKAAIEVEQLVKLMIQFGKIPSTDQTGAAYKGKELNAFRKLQGLRRRSPPLFWVVGPKCESRAFGMEYSECGIVKFRQIDFKELRYEGRRLATSAISSA